MSLGAREIKREVFIKILKKYLDTYSIKGLWNNGPVSMKVNLLQN